MGDIGVLIRVLKESSQEQEQLREANRYTPLATIINTAAEVATYSAHKFYNAIEALAKSADKK